MVAKQFGGPDMINSSHRPNFDLSLIRERHQTSYIYLSHDPPHVRLRYSSQTAWVLYGQASRAISTR